MVDEVIRIDGEQLATTSHMEDMDKLVAKLGAQLKHVTKTTAALEHASKIKKEDKENTVNMSKAFVPDTCKACEQSNTRLVALEANVQR